MSIKKANEKMVVIKPEAIEEVTEGGIVRPDMAKEKLMKLQNRGHVTNIGDNCVFVTPGCFISFYRNAATPITVDGEDLLIIHESHILVILTAPNA